MNSPELEKKLYAAIKIIKHKNSFRSDSGKIDMINICALAELYLRNNRKDKFNGISEKIDEALKRYTE